MPFKSAAQYGFLRANKPEIFAKFKAHERGDRFSRRLGKIAARAKKKQRGRGGK